MKNFLIVDDSLFVVTQLSQILKKGGYNVVGHASNGEDAIKKLRQKSKKIDIVTLDISMPRMDGITALKKMRDIKPGIKFIIISAIAKVDTVKQTKSLGADGYIVKPLSSSKVLERLKEIC
ncbi:MAG: response regulator [Spirochaetes bacterium]|nr:response regulator [Spirochaetota bacterium]